MTNTQRKIVQLTIDIVGLSLFCAVLAGTGERRNEYHYMRGYLAGLAAVERRSPWPAPPGSTPPEAMTTA